MCVSPKIVVNIMAQGKNKRVPKGRKGAKKRVGDPMAKKEVYEVKAPSYFAKRNVGKTFVNKTGGGKIASDYLKGRVVEVNLADLQGNEDQSYRKVKLVVEEVQGRNCLTNFHGMDFTRDMLCSLIRKWQTLIEAHIDAETKDGFRVRLFCIAFTARRNNQVKKTCYANAAQIKQIRRIIMDKLTAEVTSNDLQNLVKTLIADSLSKKIVKETSHIFPLQNVFVRKVKVVRRPKFDVAHLLSIHQDVPDVADAKPESEGAKNLLTAEVSK